MTWAWAKPFRCWRCWSSAASSSLAGNGRQPPPSLVVVPRSLVFNWKHEAERFAPQLRVLDHTGIGRTQARGSSSTI